MTGYNHAVDENKDFARVAITHLQQQAAIDSEESVTQMPSHALRKKNHGLRSISLPFLKLMQDIGGFNMSSKGKRLIDKDTEKETEVLNRIDCLDRNLANIRSGIPEIVRDAVRDTVIQFYKEREKPEKYMEVGYR